MKDKLIRFAVDLLEGAVLYGAIALLALPDDVDTKKAAVATVLGALAGIKAVARLALATFVQNKQPIG